MKSFYDAIKIKNIHSALTVKHEIPAIPADVFLSNQDCQKKYGLIGEIPRFYLHYNTFIQHSLSYAHGL